MSYAAVNTAKADAATSAQVALSMLKRAGVRVAALANTEDQKESAVCRTILDGTAPAAWATIVLILLDIAGTIATHTDAQVDTAVDSAWAYFIKSRV